MPSKPADLQAQLDAWRAQGADRVDPLRFGLIAALARHAGNHDGQVRQRLDARLAELVDAFTKVLAERSGTVVARSSSDSPLKQLLDQLRTTPRVTAPLQAQSIDAGNGSIAPGAPAPAMPELDEFQQLWSRIRIDSLLRQCLDSLPDDAGPLHSSVLAYRAMALMQALSPAYLQHFIAYVDGLAWLEQLGGTPPANGADAGRGAGGRRSSGRRKK